MATRIRIAPLALSLLGASLLVSQGGLFAPARAGEVYQWKDASGTTHYSDAPPPKGAFQSRDIRQRDGTPALTATPAQPTTAANANCTLARTNLDRLKAGGNIGLDADGDGKPDAPFSDEQRAQQTALAERNIKTFCSASADATAS